MEDENSGMDVGRNICVFFHHSVAVVACSYYRRVFKQWSPLTSIMSDFYAQDAPGLVTVEPGVQVTSELAILMAAAMALGTFSILLLIYSCL